MVYVTAIHQVGGSGHEHIDSVQWNNPQSGEAGQATRATMVHWIRDEGGQAFVTDGAGHTAQVGVVVDHNPPFIRTYADGLWSDNLLALPLY